jgi:hypothetical protein
MIEKIRAWEIWIRKPNFEPIFHLKTPEKKYHRNLLNNSTSNLQTQNEFKYK